MPQKLRSYNRGQLPLKGSEKHAFLCSRWTDPLRCREVTDLIAISLVSYIDLIQLLSNFTGNGRTLTSPEAHTKWTSTFLMSQSTSGHWLLWAQRWIWGLSPTLSCICWRPQRYCNCLKKRNVLYVWGSSLSILFDSSCESLGDAVNNL